MFVILAATLKLSFSTRLASRDSVQSTPVGNDRGFSRGTKDAPISQCHEKVNHKCLLYLNMAGNAAPAGEWRDL